jgi:hypothetical protein
MALQIPSSSLSSLANQGVQAIQHYNYAPENSRLDPITAQILKTQNPALEVMKQFENGAVQRMWEEQKKLPSATWLGNLMDWYLGWGIYYYRHTENIEKTQEKTQRDLLEYNEVNEKPCPDYAHNLPPAAHFNISASLDVYKYPNNSCSFIDSVEYHVKLITYNRHASDEIFCRVVSCVQKRFNSCQPACLPCINATGEERTNFLNDTEDYNIFQSKIDPRIYWLVTVNADDNLNRWKMNQNYQLFNPWVSECEDLALYKPPELGPYLSFFLPPAITLGALGVYILCRRKNNENEYMPLASSV